MIPRDAFFFFPCELISLELNLWTHPSLGILTLRFHSHQNVDVPSRNTRYARLTFHIAQPATLHGFAGYFDSKLYNDVHISMSASIYQLIIGETTEKLFAHFFFPAFYFSPIAAGILPATFSEGMFSWFPIYFPLRTPVYVPAPCDLAIDLWRCVSESSGRVWYEWCVSSPATALTTIHNPNGRSYWIGL
jgi:protein arginine N-methyltransferase 5